MCERVRRIVIYAGILVLFFSSIAVGDTEPNDDFNTAELILAGTHSGELNCGLFGGMLGTRLMGTLGHYSMIVTFAFSVIGVLLLATLAWTVMFRTMRRSLREADAQREREDH